MNKLDEFKLFVKNNPRLIDKVQSNEYSWQQLYEAYDIYGESHPLFSKKINNEKVVRSEPLKNTFSFLKNIDMDKVSENLQSIKKVIGALGELTSINEDKKEELPSFSKKSSYRRYND